MYVTIRAADHLVPPSENPEAKTSCTELGCAVSALFVLPHRKLQPNSWTSEAPLAEAPVGPAHDTRYHVPLERARWLQDYRLHVAVTGAEHAARVVVSVLPFLCIPCRNEAPCGMCAQPQVVVLEPAAVVELPLQELKLPAAGAPYRVEARVLPKEGAHATTASRVIYVDDDGPTFGAEFELIRDEYLVGAPSDRLQYPLIKRDILSWHAALVAESSKRLPAAPNYFTAAFTDEDDQDEPIGATSADDDATTTTTTSSDSKQEDVSGSDDDASEDDDVETNATITVTYPNLGWSYTVHHDPGVIEVNATALTLRGYLAIRQLVQAELFDFAEKGFPLVEQTFGIRFGELGLPPEEKGKAIRLVPSPRAEANASGHIHIGVHPSFAGDAWLLRNFLASYYNFTTFGCGVFYRDFANAPPLQLLGLVKKMTAALSKVQDIPGPTLQALEFLQAIRGTVHVSTFAAESAGDRDDAHKYQGISFRTIDPTDEITISRSTMEIRTFRAQRSFDEFLLLIDMLEQKIDFLRHHRKEVPLAPPPKFMGNIRAYIASAYGEAGMCQNQYYDGNMSKDTALEKLVDEGCNLLALQELSAFLEGTTITPTMLQNIVKLTFP